MKTKRDEWSCPCCGTPNDGSYCEPCTKAECGEVDYRFESPCVVELRAKGWRPLGTGLERVQMKDRTFALCRVEAWRRVDGEVSFATRVLEVLS